MEKLFKRGLTSILSLILVFSLVYSVNLQTNAATVDYVKSGKYIYNWGTREEVATFLSPNAEKFYSDNNTSYANLAALLGSSNINSVPSSNLYKELQKLMASNHTYNTSYGDTRNLYQYTDCQNSGKTSKRISSFYSGVDIGPSWDAGKTWNREHTWPKSKTNYKSVDNGDVNEATDIMSLRPTASSENTSRLNKAYGTTTNGTYFNPNHFTNGMYDLRGDCARIMLYVYVRWGNTGKMWGGSGVIESKDILLKWIEEDPVDTWELGRNDSVESITGTRNVFVDYPELIFTLFGEQVPSNYQTPSGNAQSGTVSTPQPTPQPTPSPTPQPNPDSTPSTTPVGCTHSNAQLVAAEDPRCEIEGYTEGKYCPDCKQYISGRKLIEATGHNYSGECDATCDICGYTQEIADDVTHSFGDDNICTVCGIDNPDKPVEEEQDIGADVQDTSKGGFAWFIIIGGILVVGAGVTLIIIYREKIWPKETE